MKYGFTLVELSIVLLIIGLMTSAVLVGKDLIKSAEYKATISEYNTYKTAANIFKDQYFYYPGDMRNAFDFWGADCAPTAAFCNGNGNGIIKLNEGGAPNQENYMFWKHLSLAEILPKPYAGPPTIPAPVPVEVGKHLPASSMGRGSGYYIFSPWTLYGKNVYNSMGISACGNCLSVLGKPILTPKEAWTLDKKIDDGLPSSGMVWGRDENPSSSGCTDVKFDTASPAEYLLTETEQKCIIQIKW